MAVHISINEANVWADKSKLTVGSIDTDLEDAAATMVLAMISQVVDTSTFVDTTNTPSLVRKIIAMQYMGWFYERVYSEDENFDTYGKMLLQQAKSLADGIMNGTLFIQGLAPGVDLGNVIVDYYPTDQSTATDTTFDDMSLGPEKFQMGMIW